MMEQHQNLEDGLLSAEKILSVSDEAVSEIEEELLYEELFVERKVVLDGITFYFMTSINNTLLGSDNTYGKSLGGVRVMDYWDRGSEFASYEIRRRYGRLDSRSLSKDMTEKWASLELEGALLADKGYDISPAERRSFHMGGGKTVVFTENIEDYDSLTERQFEILWRDLFGEHIDNLVDSQGRKGIHITGEDVKTDVRAMTLVAERTPYVSCHDGPVREGFVRGTGNPSRITARGVEHYMEGIVDPIFWNCDEGDGLNGLTIVVQGTGNVGKPLVTYIREDYPDANIILAEVDIEKAKTIANYLQHDYPGQGKIEVLSDPKDIYSEDVLSRADIFSYNALSFQLNDQSVPILVNAIRKYNKLKMICGATNSLFAKQHGIVRKDLAQKLHFAGIYVGPDFQANNGGILATTEGFPGREISSNLETSEKLVKGNKYIAKLTYDKSKEFYMLPHLVAEKLGHKVLAAYKEIKRPI